MADLKDDVCEPSLFPKHKKPEISASRVSGELEFEVFSTGSKLVGDTQSSDGMASVLPTPVKSDISTEMGLPLSSESSEQDATKTHDLNAAEDGLNPRSHELHQRTESSCSNSLSTVFPVSVSNHSYQEAAFKEMCAFRNSVVSADSSNSKSFDCKLEGHMTASSDSGACHEQISEESKDTVGVKAKLVEMGSEIEVENQDTCVNGFDLNEDINVNGIDDCIQTQAALVSSQGVIQVVAKAGRSNGQPKVPPIFEGRLDWKGTAETSAFRPACSSKTSETKSCSRYDDTQAFTGIDLNVAAVEDKSSIGMPMDSCSDAGLKQSKTRPLIDLNCSSDPDEFTQPPVLPNSGNPLVVDLNLIQNALPVNNTDSANPRGHYYNFIGHDYFSNARMPVAVPNTPQPAEFLHRVASMQPKLPFGSPSVNLQYYHPPNSQVHFSAGVPLPPGVHFSGSVPVSYASTRYPALLNPGMVHTSFCTPQLVQFVQEPGSTNIPPPFPNLDVRSMENLSANRMKMDEVRQFPFMAPTSERLHRESWYDATTVKRKEPEGGFRHYQLGYK